MNWNYQQNTGALSRNDYFYALGFSGSGAGRNSAELDNLPSIGAVPAGEYRIIAAPSGPGVFALTPMGHMAKNRSGLHLATLDPAHPTAAAPGALVLPRHVLTVIASSGIRFLTVQGSAELPQPQA